MFYIYFSCFVLFFCFLKNGLQSSHFLLACCDVSEKMLFFIQQIGEDIFCFFSFCHFSFLFFCSLVCLFLKRVCEINLFIFELFFFFEIPCSSFFSLHIFVTKKKSTPKKIIFVFSVLFFVSLFSFQHFSFFLSLLFSLIIFSFHLFCSSLRAFLSFFSSLFLHSFFISPSQCFSFSFFSLPHVSLSVFLHRRF